MNRIRRLRFGLLVLGTMLAAICQFAKPQKDDDRRVIGSRAPAATVREPRPAPGVTMLPEAIEQYRSKEDEGAEAEHQTAQNPAGLARERYLKRLDDNGAIPPNALMLAKQHADAMPMLVPAVNPGEFEPRDGGIWSWEWLGPGNIGGRIRASILIHPTIPSRMWIGSVGGGIWRSTNSGASWTAVNDFLAGLAVSCMALDVANPNVMYAGTGEGFGNIDALPGAGIFKSTNGGLTWSQLPATIPVDPILDQWSFVSRIAVDPLNSNILLAATNAGIFRSVDAGTNWTQVFVGPVTDVKFNRSTDRAVAAGVYPTVLSSNDAGATWPAATLTGDPASTTLRLAFIADGDANDDTVEVFSTAGFVVGDLVSLGGSALRAVKSIVDSDTMTIADINVNLPPGASVKSARGGRCELAWGSGSVVYLSMDAGGGVIYKSTNSGINYNLVIDAAGLPQYLGAQGWYANTIWVSPSDNNFVVVGGLDLYRSINGGAVLTKISNWADFHNGGAANSAHADQHFIVENPGFNGTTNKTVFFANDGGIQKAADINSVSQNSGWTNLANNLGITQFFGGSAAPDGSLIAGGAQDNDKLHYTPTDGTGGWMQPQTGDGGYAAVNYDNPLIVYGEYTHLSILKSNTGGRSYSPAIVGCGDCGVDDHSLFIAPFSIDPNNPVNLVAGGTGLWRTTNSAATWQSIRPAIAGNPASSAIDISTGNSTRIWAGYADGRVSRTTNSVTSWIDVDDNSTNGSSRLPNRFVTDIAINPANSSRVFVTFGGYATDDVWYTSDNGVSWQQRTGAPPNDLPAVQVNTVRFHPTNANWVYIGTDVGVFASEDAGLSWSRTPIGADHDGPANVEVSELFWQGDSLIAATHGRGMFRTRPLDIVYCDSAYSGTERGTLTQPYNTVLEGYDAAGHGSALSIKSGDYNEPSMTMNKRIRLTATNGLARIH